MSISTLNIDRGLRSKPERNKVNHAHWQKKWWHIGKTMILNIKLGNYMNAKEEMELIWNSLIKAEKRNTFAEAKYWINQYKLYGLHANKLIKKQQSQIEDLQIKKMTSILNKKKMSKLCGFKIIRVIHDEI